MKGVNQANYCATMSQIQSTVSYCAYANSTIISKADPFTIRVLFELRLYVPFNNFSHVRASSWDEPVLSNENKVSAD